MFHMTYRKKEIEKKQINKTKIEIKTDRKKLYPCNQYF